MEKELAFSLLSIMNAANVFGRFVPNFVADRYPDLSQFLPKTVQLMRIRYGGVNVLLPLSIACIIRLQ